MRRWGFTEPAASMRQTPVRVKSTETPTSRGVVLRSVGSSVEDLLAIA